MAHADLVIGEFVLTPDHTFLQRSLQAPISPYTVSEYRAEAQILAIFCGK